MKIRSSNRSGFTLVEVALALMVTAVGMMAVFSLFPVGLDMNKKAIDDTQLSIFADDVIAGVRAQLWKDGWNVVQNPTAIRLRPTARDVWKIPPATDIEATGTKETMIYEFIDYPIVDMAVRYKLNVNTLGNRAYFRLELINGETGPTNNTQVYYTEVFKTDMSWQ